MNRKYIKENKKALREFLGATIAAIVTGALTKGFDSKKELDKIGFINPKRTSN